MLTHIFRKRIVIKTLNDYIHMFCKRTTSEYFSTLSILNRLFACVRDIYIPVDKLSRYQSGIVAF